MPSGSTGIPFQNRFIICVLLGTSIILLCLFGFIGYIRMSHELSGRRLQHLKQQKKSETKFVTLSYNTSRDAAVIDNNCARLHSGGYVFEIHTDDLSQSFCDTCTCVPFKMTDCDCPDPTISMCSHCNKLYFFIDLVRNNSAFVLLDSDLVILKDTFMPNFLSRTESLDFLASYGFVSMSSWTYRTQFNSGLLFIRRLDGLNYSEMLDIKKSINAIGDQIVISAFVHKYYSDFDILSLRWHCRFLERRENSIPIEHCFTFHGHKKQRNIFLKEYEFLNTTTSS